MCLMGYVIHFCEINLLLHYLIETTFHSSKCHPHNSLNTSYPFSVLHIVLAPMSTSAVLFYLFSFPFLHTITWFSPTSPCAKTTQFLMLSNSNSQTKWSYNNILISNDIDLINMPLGPLKSFYSNIVYDIVGSITNSTMYPYNTLSNQKQKTREVLFPTTWIWHNSFCVHFLGPSWRYVGLFPVN